MDYIETNISTEAQSCDTWVKAPGQVLSVVAGAFCGSLILSNLKSFPL